MKSWVPLGPQPVNVFSTRSCLHTESQIILLTINMIHFFLDETSAARYIAARHIATPTNISLNTSKINTSSARSQLLVAKALVKISQHESSSSQGGSFALQPPLSPLTKPFTHGSAFSSSCHNRCFLIDQINVTHLTQLTAQGRKK